MGRLSAVLVFVGMMQGCTSGPPAVDAYPSVHWPTIHRSPKNTDFLEVEGTRLLESGFSVSLGTVAAVLTVGPTGTLYVTTGSSTGDAGCYLHALDPDTGEMRWCSDVVGATAVSSSALSDVDGNLYLADDQVMVSFDTDGQVRWSTPIAAAPQSAQFLDDGSLFFVSRNGVAYVLDRASGEAVVDPIELVPDVPVGPQMGCLIGGADSNCPAANTPAVDLATGTIVMTLTPPGSDVGSLVALRYDRSGPALEQLWEVPVLQGGGGASPALDATGERIYVTDGEGTLLAVAAEDGAVIWELPVGDAPLGSPAVTPGGRIFPGPLGPLLAVDDLGDAGSVAWEVPDAGAYGVVAVSGGTGYVAGDGALTVFDVATGDIVQTLDGPAISIGTSVDSDGHVFTASFSTVFGYRPAP